MNDLRPRKKQNKAVFERFQCKFRSYLDTFHIQREPNRLTSWSTIADKILVRTQWNELKREYLARQTSLLQKMKPSNVATTYNPKKSRARANPSGQKGGSTQIVVPSRDRPPHIPSSRARQAANEVPSSALDEAIGSNDRATEHAETLAYPPDCLVFVKNLYPGTNKTTLKSLFGRPFAAETSTKVNAIDYVDYQKGMASVSICTQSFLLILRLV